MEQKEVPSIIDAVSDDHWFGAIFKDKESWRPWFIYLKSISGLPLNENDLELFKKCTGRTKPLEKPVREVWSICGRRSGKSFVSAVIAVYLAVFKDFQKYLPIGGMGKIMIIAADKKQATNIFQYVDGILNLPAFEGLVLKSLVWEIILRNRISIEIKTCDYRTLRGFQCVACILDEICFFRVEGKSPADEILRALRPSLRVIPESLLISVSTPYSRAGPMWEIYREKFGKDDPKTLVWRADARTMNPLIDQEMIDDALREDPEGARAEWLAEFRTDVAAFLDPIIIENSIIPNRHELPKIEGVQYKGFADPSGGAGGDSFCLAIGHAEKSGRIVIDRLCESLNPNPQKTIEEYAEVLKGYGVRSVKGDKYAGEFVSQGFKACGITYEASEKTKSELYLEFQPKLNQGLVELLDNKKLVSQLRSLERKTRSGGKDSVDNFYGHDDLSNCLAGVVWMCVGKTYLSEAEKNSRMPVHAQKKNVDPILSAREEMDRFMRTEGAGIIDKKKIDPWNLGDEKI